MNRLAQLATRLELPLLVTSTVNVRYLTGLASSNAALLAAPGAAATLYTDFRYVEIARDLPGAGDAFAVEQIGRNMLGDIGRELAGREIGFEAAHLTVAGHQALAGGGATLVPTSGIVEAIRAVKDADELARIERAAEISDKLYADLAEQAFTGRQEGELAWWIERRFRELGADGLSFPPIVASGARGALPHHHPGSDVIPADTLVTVDAGCVVDGYCSDCTRTFSVGAPPDVLLEADSLVRQAQLDGLAAIRPGALGADVDAASRLKIEEAGLGSRYGHGLGHGVGAEIHEAPTLRPQSTDVLEAGNVVTVEPGIYLPKAGGVRIEDLVVVSGDGCSILTRFTKELLTVR